MSLATDQQRHVHTGSGTVNFNGGGAQDDYRHAIRLFNNFIVNKAAVP